MKLMIQEKDAKITLNGNFTDEQILAVYHLLQPDKNQQVIYKAATDPAVKKEHAGLLTTYPPEGWRTHAKEEESVINTRPHVLPKVNSGRTLTTSLADNEDFKKLLDETTPIDEEKTVPAHLSANAPALKNPVKVKVDCPHCHHKAVQSAGFGYHFIKCDRCRTPLFLQPAAANQWGEKDADGNTYRAEQIYKA